MTEVESEKKEPMTHFYVGIGSMMNPHSLAARDLSPLRSWPCRCTGFIRQFWGRMGMAEIFEQVGGGLHNMSLECCLNLFSDDK